MKKSGKGLLIFFIIVAIILVLINIGDRKENLYNKSKTNLLERTAHISDIECDVSYKFPASVKITVNPNVDIDDLQIKLAYYNSSNRIIYTKYVEFGDVVCGRQYEESISIFDYDISVLTSNRSSIVVSGGTVSIFA